VYLRAGVDFLVAAQRDWEDARATAGVSGSRARGWGYTLGALPGDPRSIDLVNTHYALLGLRAAERCGLAVPHDTWRKSLSLLLKWQAEDGPSVPLAGNVTGGATTWRWRTRAKARGFAYAGPANARRQSTGSTTAAGLASLLLCMEALESRGEAPESTRSAVLTAVWDAAAWLQINYSPVRNAGAHPEAPWYASYLVALSRAGSLGGVRFLGKHDWYQECAEEVMGGVNEKRSQRADEALELLFLTSIDRGDRPTDLTGQSRDK
jgi:hypothetical protein